MRVSNISFRGMSPSVKHDLIYKRMEDNGTLGFQNINPDGKQWFDDTEKRDREDYIRDVLTVAGSDIINIRKGLHKDEFIVTKTINDDVEETLGKLGADNARRYANPGFISLKSAALLANDREYERYKKNVNREIDD